MRYKVTITEQVPGVGLVESGHSVYSGAECDGAVIFSTVVESRPSLEKLVAALTPPRIRKPRSQKA